MKLNVLMKTARNAVIELVDGGIFYTNKPYKIYLNNRYYGESNTVVTNLYDLKPSTEYCVKVKDEEVEVANLIFTTDYEFVTLNVKEFGAKGDGINDDTIYIQAAIMAAPKESRILIPKGNYLIKSLFLKSDIKIELAKEAVLLATTNREDFPKFPGLIESYDEKEEYNLGTWEGNPLPMFSGIITGVNVENVVIYGEGMINGKASYENWWKDAKVMRGAFRPRSIFLNHCKNIIVQGITICNSPSWVIHPYFSENLGFYGMHIKSEAHSPNTDGLNPESCKGVSIIGMHFSVGDDCIAIKSGKIYMGAKHKVPSENIMVRQCLMEDGHGAITVGSEIAAGVKNVLVKECLFLKTDRGLRIKTRRGRGEDSIIENITFENIRMDHVKTPFVVNSYYFCDPDGHSEYVQSRDYHPVDHRTPFIKDLHFKNIICDHAHIAAAYFEGLTEQKIELIEMKNISINYAEEVQEDIPAMTEGIVPCKKQGIFMKNIKKFVLENVSVQGQEGERYIIDNIDEIVK